MLMLCLFFSVSSVVRKGICEVFLDFLHSLSVWARRSGGSAFRVRVKAGKPWRARCTLRLSFPCTDQA
jgi:hypothetical protein